MEPSDTELVMQARQGDRQALAGIYDRYSDRVYSFCLSRLRNPEQAADATQDTFVRAIVGIGELRSPERLRSWLFAIARNRIIDTARDRDRLGRSEVTEMASTTSDPDTDLLAAESAALLWEAAGSLKDRDRDLLELELRQGLAGQDLADALEVTVAHLHTMQSRLRDRVEKALGGLLIARQGRDDCATLAQLLADWDGRYTLAVRSRVTRHVRSCEVCERTRRLVVRPEAFLGALPLSAAPSFLRDRTVGAMSASLATSAPDPSDPSDPSGSSASTDAGPDSDRGAETGAAGSTEEPVGEEPPQFSELTVVPGNRLARLAGTKWFAAVAVTALIMLFTGATIMVVLFYRAPEDLPAGDVQAPPTSAPAAAADPPADPSSPVATATNPVTPTDSAPTEPAPVTSTSTTTTTTTATTTPPTAPPTTASTTTSAPTTSVPPDPGPTFVRLTARPTSVEVDQGSCTGETTEVIATVEDPDGVMSVEVQWNDGSADIVTPLDAGGGAFVGFVGPFRSVGTSDLRVLATDDLGSVTTAELTVEVTGCPPG